MNRVTMITIILLIIAATIIFLYTYTFKQYEKENLKDSPITEEVIVALENAESVCVQKVERELIENQDGGFDCNYYTYVSSEFMQIGTEPVVDDYSLAIAEHGFDQNLIHTISFKDAFGFVYHGENGWGLFQKLLKTHGIDGDIRNVTFDKELYERTKQKQYVLNEPCSITKELLGSEYDLILEERVHYELGTLVNGLEVPECFLVTVKYKEGGEIITKTLYLQVGINEWEEGAE